MALAGVTEPCNNKVPANFDLSEPEFRTGFQSL